MAKFNKPGIMAGETRNAAEGISYERPEIKHEIASIVLTALLSGKDSYYEDEQSRIERLEVLMADACKKPDTTEFLAKSMIFSRSIGNMRSLPHLIAVVLAENAPKDGINLRSAFKKSFLRVDDMTEVISLWNSRHTDNGKSKMPRNALRRAIKDTFESDKFNDFQYRRYAGGSHGVKLKDLVKLSHPNPTKMKDKETTIRILNDTLPEIETMETMRSAGKGTSASFEQLLANKKMGYMQAVKNIRNAILDGLSDKGFENWVNLITNPKVITGSRMFPFRYFDAWEALLEAHIDAFKMKLIKKAFDTAITLSVKNLGLVNETERVAIIIDDSGSMAGSNCFASSSCFKVGMTLASIILHGLNRENVIFYSFGSECIDRTVLVETKSPIDFISGFYPEAGCTYIEKPFGRLIKTKTAVDKIIILTDLQLYDDEGLYGINKKTLVTYYETYCKAIGIRPKLLFWNLEAYSGGTPMRMSKDILELSGFSEKIIPFISKIWDNPNYLIDEIEAIIL